MMFDFIPSIWKHIKDALAPLLSKASFTTVLKFLTNWYTYMAAAGIYVVYKLFNALNQAGIISGFTMTVKGAVGSVYNIADKCFAQIGNLQSMLDCIKNTH